MSVVRSMTSTMASSDEHAMVEEDVGSSSGESSASQVWERPVQYMSALDDDLVFMYTDIANTMDKVEPESATSTGPVPCLQVFGVTMEGSSVLLRVHGFIPYMWIGCPGTFKDEHCGMFRKAINLAMLKRLPFLDKWGRPNSSRFENCALEVSIEMREDIMGWTGNGPQRFIRIYMASPNLMYDLRDILHEGKVVAHDIPCSGVPFKTYESNVAYPLRWMVDSDVTGAGWIRVPKGRYRMAVENNDYKNPGRVSRCGIEAFCTCEAVESLGAEGEWGVLAPMRVLSFDIECMTDKGFPTPERDAIIQISNIVKVVGSDKPIIKNIFTLGGCTPIAGAEVLSYDSESDMLRAWYKFVYTVDPDIFTGYNIDGFDFMYIVTRTEHLGVAKILPLGRIIKKKTKIVKKTFSSKAYGMLITYPATHEGVPTFDVIQILRRGSEKLPSYKLNSVCSKFLGDQKHDLPYSSIPGLQNGDDNDRQRIAIYCIKDAQLPLDLIENQQMIVNSMEMARVAGVPPSYIMTRGQQIKVFSQILRKARAKGMVVPYTEQPKDTGKKSTDVTYEGATVIEPKTGFYDTPIATLDFASLYPSIMQAHNLCYSTFISPELARTMPPEQYTLTPEGSYFLKTSVQKGILPEILEEFLAARKIAKRQMAMETDPMKKAVQNGRQMALKVSANSVYGFTGAVNGGMLPMVAISKAVTGFGREMIELTSSLVESRYTIANGYSHDAEVIYGDTDSVMVRFGVDTVRESMVLGKEAAAYVTESFVKPISLEFEKIYFPYLLLAKKRYAGLFFTRPDKWDKMDCKGIVTVRRDNCGLVRMLIDAVLRLILIERDVAGAIAYVKKTVSDLLCGRIEMSLMIITKGYSKKQEEYKVKQAHVELVKRMEKRDPGGDIPSIGDRIPFIYIGAMKNSKAYQRSEDPIYAIENGILPDANHYLKTQLKKPVLNIFDPIIKHAESKLFHGEHTRTIVQATSAPILGIARFAVRINKCLSCKCAIGKHARTQALCELCEEHEAMYYMEQMQKVATAEMKYSRCWTQCQECQGSNFQEVLCKNRVCPVFYIRTSSRVDVKREQSILERFEGIDLNSADMAW